MPEIVAALACLLSQAMSCCMDKVDAIPVKKKPMAEPVVARAFLSGLLPIPAVFPFLSYLL